MEIEAFILAVILCMIFAFLYIIWTAISTAFMESCLFFHVDPTLASLIIALLVFCIVVYHISTTPSKSYKK